jgi:hypothetical protein
MMPLKPQISKLHTEKSCLMGFNVLQRLYSRAFLKRVKLSVHVNVIVCLFNVLLLCISFNLMYSRENIML